MKYALLVHVNKEAVEEIKDANAKAAARIAGLAYGEALRAAGIFVAGARLEPPQTATMVSVRDGQRQVHDGPYAETKECLGGFVIDVPDLDAALEWAARNRLRLMHSSKCAHWAGLILPRVASNYLPSRHRTL